MRGACFVLATCAACSFRPGVALLDGATLDDGGNEIVTWDIDSAADFASGTRVDVGIEPWGSLTPAGYSYGNLYSRGADAAIVWHATDASFSVDAATNTPTGASLWAGTAVTSTNNMTTLGITGATFSAWSLGDVYLKTGTYQLQLQANDVGFVEIAPPKTSAYATAIVSTGGTLVQQSLVVAADGWYPIRTGFTSTTASWQFDLQIEAPGDIALRRFGRDELRARVEEGRGLMQILSSHQLLTGARSSHQVAGDAIEGLVWPLFGQAGPGNSFSVRWRGQFYAKAAGAYVLAASSVGGNRLEAAGRGSASNFTADQTSASASMVTLNSTGPGWYDVAFDLNAPGPVTPAFTLSVASGPELSGMPLPLDRLRAVEMAGDRIVAGSNAPNAAFQDQGSATATLTPFVALAGETVTSLVARTNITNPEYGPGRIRVTIANPHGDKFGLDPASYSVGADGTATYYWQIDPTTPGAAALFQGATVDGGSWTMTVQDLMSSSGNTGGTLHEANVSLHTDGGPSSIATDGRWQSEVVDTATTLVEVATVAWVERSPLQPSRVQLRACDAPCIAEAWVDAQNGAPLDLGTGHRYLQARVEVFSDGVVAPDFDELTIVYKRKPL